MSIFNSYLNFVVYCFQYHVKLSSKLKLRNQSQKWWPRGHPRLVEKGTTNISISIMHPVVHLRTLIWFSTHSCCQAGGPQVHISTFNSINTPLSCLNLDSKTWQKFSNQGPQCALAFPGLSAEYHKNEQCSAMQYYG